MSPSHSEPSCYAKSLSSAVTTFAYRVFLPTMGGLVIGVVVAVRTDGWLLSAGALILVLAGLLAIANAVLKTVVLDGDALLVSDFFRTIRVPLDQVESISSSAINPETIFLALRGTTPFGSDIWFLPTPRMFRGKPHPTIVELRRLCPMAKGSR